jgi:ribonuclease HI
LIEVYFDGLCQPINPGGISCYAFLVKVDGRTIYSEYGIAGEPFSPDSTNNIAEYTALVKALQWLLAANLYLSKIEIKSDSQLIVNQLIGNYKVRAKRIIPLYKQALVLKKKFRHIEIKWVPRESNREADNLTTKAYNKALQDNPEYLDKIISRRDI